MTTLLKQTGTQFEEFTCAVVQTVIVGAETDIDQAALKY